jgi:benzodiazapine receptor
LAAEAHDLIPARGAQISAMRSALALVVFLALAAAAGAFSAQFAPGAWYAGLARPPLAPPNAVFGPVWTVLYVAIAVAGWLVWKARPASPAPLARWAGQLALNAAWSWLFFGLQRPGLALALILALLAAVAATTAAFFGVRRAAGWLLAPYAAWVAFASYLNAGFWFLNR